MPADTNLLIYLSCNGRFAWVCVCVCVSVCTCLACLVRCVCAGHVHVLMSMISKYALFKAVLLRSEQIDTPSY